MSQFLHLVPTELSVEEKEPQWKWQGTVIPGFELSRDWGDNCFMEELLNVSSTTKLRISWTSLNVGGG